MPATLSIDAHSCPLCGAPNQCAMELERESGVKQPPCWCTQVEFKHEVLARIPAQVRGLACICARCAQEQSPQ